MKIPDQEPYLLRSKEESSKGISNHKNSKGYNKHLMQYKKSSLKLEKDQVKSSMGFNLKFLDKEFEVSYRNSLNSFQVIHLKLFLLFEIVYSLLAWLLNPLGLEKSALFIGLHVLNILFVAVFAYLLKRPKIREKTEIFIVLFVSAMIVGYCESTKSNRQFWSKTMYITSGTTIQVLLLIPIIARCYWKYCCISAIFSIAYLHMRFIDQKENFEIRGFATFAFSIDILIIIASAYFSERKDRRLFYTQKKSEESLRQFEYLIREVLPSSILIAKNQEVVFFNKETRKTLDIKNFAEIKNRLPTSHEGANSRKKENNINNYNNNNDINNNNNNNILEAFTDKRNEEAQSLLELISCVEREQGDNFFSYNGTFSEGPRRENNNNNRKNDLALTELNLNFDEKKEKKINENLEEIPKREIKLEKGVEIEIIKKETSSTYSPASKFFDIQLGRVTWKGEDATLVVISHDYNHRRMSYLTDQARYKDKLLATVSHDLRTPLNGVIGIIEFVLETIKDESLRKRFSFKI